MNQLAPQPTTDLVTLGEALTVFKAPGGVAFRRSAGLLRFTAGAEVNVAVACARLGLRSAFVGRVGSDLGGEAILDDLRCEGIDHRYVVIDDTAPTGAIIRETTPSGSRVSYLRRGSAGSGVSEGDLPTELITGARAAHVSGVTAALSDSARKAAGVFLATARQAGVMTSFDINHRSRLWSQEQAAPVLRELAEGHDLLVGGREEMIMVFGSDDAREVRERSECALVVVTDGSGPVHVASASDTWQEPTTAVTVVDPVGAGDALVGGVLAGLLGGLSVQSAVQQGMQCGAAVVQAVGDWTALPWGSAGVLHPRSGTGQVHR